MTPEIGMSRRQSWRPHQRKQHIGFRHARDRMLRRGLGPRHGQKAHSGTYETHQRPPTVYGGGGERGTTIVRRIAALHTIDEVAEGNEAMEKRERQEGITTGQAKGQTQRWQPLQPNLARVNEAARRWPDPVHGAAASRRRWGARTGVPAAETCGQSRRRSGDGGGLRAESGGQSPASARKGP